MNDFEMAKWLSQMIGQETTLFQTDSYKPGDNPSFSNNLTCRNLLTPDEITQLHPENQLLRVQGQATAVASMSNPIDGLTKAANKQIEVSTEARIAAFAAREQTNLEKYAELIGQTVDGGIADSLKRLNKAVGVLLDSAERSSASFQETTT